MIRSPRHWLNRAKCKVTNLRPSKGGEYTEILNVQTRIRMVPDPFEWATQIFSCLGLGCSLTAGITLKECQSYMIKNHNRKSKILEILEDVAWKVLPYVSTHSGPTAQKGLQWMSSRMDLFGKECCARLANSEIHAPRSPFGEYLLSIYDAYNKVPRSLRRDARERGKMSYCQSLFDEYINKENLVRRDPYYIPVDRDSVMIVCKEDLLGSGVIADVYLAYLVEPMRQGVKKVAWKVQRRGIHDRMFRELDALLIANDLLHSLPGCKWALNQLPMSLNAGVKEFCSMMKPQLNLSFEMQNLERLSANFTPMPSTSGYDPFDYGGNNPIKIRWFDKLKRLGNRILCRSSSSLDILELQSERSRKYLGCVTVPEVYKSISGKKALVMTFEEGLALSDVINTDSELSPFQFMDGLDMEQPHHDDVLSIRSGIRLISSMFKHQLMMHRFRKQFKAQLLATHGSAFPPLTNLSGHIISSIMLDAFMQMVVKDQFLHSDLHPGNIILRKVSPSTLERFQRARIHPLPLWELVIIDLGLSYPLSSTIRTNLFDLLWEYFTTRDFEKIASMMVHREPQGKHEIPQVKEFGKQIDKLARIFERSNIQSPEDSFFSTAALVGGLFESAFKNRIKLQTEFVQLGLSVILFDGIRASLAPSLNVIEPLESWLSRLIGHDELHFATMTLGFEILKNRVFKKNSNTTDE